MENKKLIFEIDQIDCIDNFLNSFLDYKKEKISKFIKDDKLIQNDINNLIKTIKNVGNRILNSNQKLIKHLVAGHVQSGKTDFVIGLISYIIDNINNEQINIVVNLTSSNTSIMSQNHERIKSFFDNYNHNFKIIDIKSYEELKSKKDSFKKNIIYIWSFLKNTTHLKFLKKSLSNICENINLLILDDEGDNASFNTKETSKSEDLSAINRYINEIFNLNKIDFKINFVSITATPFVHFFATNSNNIKPDYSYLLKPGSNYSSIIDFNELINQQNSKVISIIDENIDDYDDDLYELPKSLKISILTFFINSAIIQQRVYNKFFSRMIVNAFSKISEQQTLVYLISDYLDNFRENEILFYKEIDDNNVFSLVYEGNDFDTNNQSKIKKYVYNEFIQKLKYEIIEFNSNNKENISNLNLDCELKKLQIIVGLYKISRGLTISNLSTIFFTFRPKTISLADTLLQRARWLGYRKNYIDRIKIFTTDNLKNDYLVIGDLINNLYNVIEISESKNIPFTNLEKFLGISNVVRDVMPVGSNRAKTHLIDGNNYNNIFTNNTYNSGKNNNDLNLLDIFKSHYIDNRREEKTNWASLRYNTLQHFISIFFYNDLDNFYSSFNIKKSKFPNIDTLMNKEVIVRFISEDLNNIVYRERIITNISDDKYYFGNGNYKGQCIINNQDLILIDFLPLKIWSKKNDFERKIIRPKLLLPYEVQNNNTNTKYSSGFIGED